MQLIDTHAHLTSEGLVEQSDNVLSRAANAGVVQVITIATDAADGRRALALAAAHDNVFVSVGIHPHEAGNVADGEVERVAELLESDKVVAIGELGLDYHYDFADRKTQQRVLAEQLDMARGFDLPVVVHAREAMDDCVEALTRHGFEGRRVVFHCFTGTADEARRLADHGWRVSFTGVVTFKNSADIAAIARVYPADQLMLETDSPYLSPVPVRHVRPNEPAHLAHTAQFVANLRSVSIDELAQQTSENARRFFQLPPVGG